MCKHHAELCQITAELNSRHYLFETLSARQIASLLWQIFMGTRRFFLTGIDAQGNLPTYNKRALPGIMQAHLNVPYSQLLGQDPGGATYEPEPAASEPGANPSHNTYKELL
jgi:hypothetical protein